MDLGDKYKLSFCYSNDGQSFQLETPFIPLVDTFVQAAEFVPFHNGKYIRAQDLRRVLMVSQPLYLPIANLMHFDLSDFILQAGVYTPNQGLYPLEQDLFYLKNGNALPEDNTPARTDGVPPPPPPSRLLNPLVEVKNYYVLLYLQLN